LSAAAGSGGLQAAGYVDRILRGDKPGDLPINASSKVDFVVNLRTARADLFEKAGHLRSDLEKTFAVPPTNERWQGYRLSCCEWRKACSRSLSSY
jgi:hypothetical protein